MLVLDKNLMEEMGKDIDSFIGKSIDISKSPDLLSSGLDIEYAKSCGVTPRELSIQVAENRIKELSSKANIQVVCFDK